MNASEKDQKLSQLFQLKRAEVPSAALWRDFEIGLQRKLEARTEPRPSWIQILRSFRQQCRFAFATLGGVACAFLAMSSLHPGSEDVTYPNLRSERMSGSTLALTLSAEPTAHYVCDNMYKSELRTAHRALAF